MRNLPRALLFIFVFSSVLRIGVFFFALTHVGSDAIIYGDAAGPGGYVELARHLSAGDGFVSLQDGVVAPEVFRSPGLHLLIAPFMYFPSGVLVYCLFLAACAAILLPLLTYLVAKPIVGVRAALVAAGLTAFEPNLIFFSFLPQSEMPFILFALGGLFSLIYAKEYSKFLFAGFAGFLLAFAVLIKPGFLIVFAASILAAGMYFLLKKNNIWRYVALTLFCFSLTLSPWLVRNYLLTGEAALSGQGWRNVYTDYLASVYAIEKGSLFSAEKEKLKDDATKYGLSRTDINNPKNSTLLRNVSLPILWQHRNTVVKLEAYLLASYFMHDGYYYSATGFGLIKGEVGESHSVSLALLSQGLGGIPVLFDELKRQYFIPLLGRMFTIGMTVLALVGAWCLRRKPIAYLFCIIIALGAVTATAIGLGVESRLRLPIEPLLFILAAVPISSLYSWYENRYLHPRL